MRKFHLGKNEEEVLQLLPERILKRIQLDEITVGITRIGQSVYAFEPTCPHRGASLVQGSLNGAGEIVCPLHEYRFDLKSGQVRSGSCRDLQVYLCHLGKEGLEIRVP